jgi:glycosyltransferase involved in cell wall biosynthesis
MPAPIIDVVIPTYNAARYIGRAIASVRAQTLPVAGIVVVDDGSADDTGSIVKRSGSDIVLIEQANRGPAAARNTGIGASRGDYVAFLDADDEWFPITLERLSAAVQRYPEAALVTGDMAAADARGRVTAESWFERRGLAAVVAGWRGAPVPNAVAALLRKNFVSTSVALARREVLVSLAGFRADLRYGEDLELWARIAARHPIVCLPEVLGLRREHPDNTTKSVEPMLRDLVKMSEIIRAWGADLLREQGVDPDEMVACARTDLGYWYFSAGRLRDARRTLAAALRDHRSARALRYLLLSCLPAGAVNGLRRVKAAIDG